MPFPLAGHQLIDIVEVTLDDDRQVRIRRDFGIIFNHDLYVIDGKEGACHCDHTLQFRTNSKLNRHRIDFSRNGWRIEK